MNYNLINIFEKLAQNSKLLEEKFKYYSYLRTIKIIKNYNINIGKQIKSSNDIKDYYLNNYRIGTKNLLKIDEILKTGTLQKIKNMNSNLNSVFNISSIRGFGIIKAKQIILKYNIKSIDDLILKYNNKELTLTHEQLLGIKYYNDLNSKIPRQEIYKFKTIFDIIINKINNLNYCILGSFRRMVKYSGDIDLLLYSNNNSNKLYLQQFVNYFNIYNIHVDKISIGKTKYSGLIKLNSKNSKVRKIDIRYVTKDSLYTSILYYTGNRDFNIYMRNIAKKLNYKLNEYGLYDLNNNTKFDILSEKDIFNILKIKYITPKKRI